MATDKQVEAALREWKRWIGDSYTPSKERMRQVLEAAEAAAWEAIESAPSLERVIVSGIQPRSGTVAAYRWYHEDMTDEHGVPMNYPKADLFRLIPQPPKETT